MADAMKNPPQLTDPKQKAGWEDGKGRFLIDGFPRKMDQALMFDKVVSIVWMLALHDLRAVKIGGFRDRKEKKLTETGLPVGLCPVPQH